MKTAQVPDKVVFRNETYSTIEPFYGPFSPDKHGLDPRKGRETWSSTANRRGYVATFAVVRNRLKLNAVYLALSRKDHAAALTGNGPLFQGKRPVKNPRSDGVPWAYRDLSHPMDHTGDLIIGRDYRSGTRFSFGPTMAGYRVIYRLTFDHGILKATMRFPVCIEMEGQEVHWPVNLSESALAKDSGPRPHLPVELPELKSAPIPNLRSDLVLKAQKKELTVRLEIDPEGATRPKVMAGSGNSDVDSRVLKSLAQWRWQPALSFKTRKSAPSACVLRWYLE